MTYTYLRREHGKVIMLNVSVNTTPDNTVNVQWDTTGCKPSGYLIKWNEKEQQVVIDLMRTFFVIR